MTQQGGTAGWLGLPTLRPDAASITRPLVTTGPASTRMAPVWLLVSAFAFLVAAAAVFGRLTVTPDTHVALVWPSSGVAYVWFVVLAVDQRFAGPPRVVSGVLLLLVSFVVPVAAGASVAAGVAFACAAWVSAFTGAVGYVRWCGRADAALVDRRGLRALCLTAILGAVFGAAVVGLASVVVPPVVSLNLMVVWVLRETSAVVLIGAVGLRWLYDDDRRLIVANPGAVALLVGVTSGCAAVVLRAGQSWPLEFLLIAVATTATVLLTVQWTTIYVLAVAVVTITATLAGGGPFAVLDPGVSAALVQAFLIVLTFSTVGLALEKDQRARAHALIVSSREVERQQAELLSGLFAMLSEAVLVIDRDSVVSYRNAAAEPFTDGDRLAGTTLPPLVHDVVVSTLAGATSPPRDVEILDGARVLSMRTHPLSHRGCPQVLVILTDVTADRRERRHLKSFAGTLAHDLRAPLTSLSTWAQLLEEEVADVGVAIDPTPIQRIHASTERMAALITDVLALATADDGPLRTRAVELTPMVAEVIREQTEALHLDLPRTQLVVHTPHTVDADPSLVRQLLCNYIGNALKYARPGIPPEVRVTSQLLPDGFVRLAVQDRGIGIPAGEEERVFEEFHRAPQHALAYDGTGLGLSICRRIVERHGGRTWAASRPAGGSCFFATLPVEPANRADSHDVGQL